MKVKKIRTEYRTRKKKFIYFFFNVTYQKEIKMYFPKKDNYFYAPNKNLREALVSFLGEFKWDWYVTLTFENVSKTFTAWNNVNRWLENLQKGEKRRIGYYIVMELTEQGAPHLHLLMGNLSGVRTGKWWTLWYEKYGRAKIQEYDPKKGAGYYLTKNIVRDACNNTESWDLEGLEYLKKVVPSN